MNSIIKKVLIIVVFFVAIVPAFSEILEYKYHKGNKYRIIAEGEEVVLLNGVISHNAQFLNRIAVEELDAKNGSGFIHGKFEVSQKSTGSYNTYEMSESYESKFWRDNLGYYDIEKKYFMPVVRDVPVFPDKNVELGDIWIGAGHEVHDLRVGFNVKEPFTFPIAVTYQYLGMDDAKKYHRIKIDYKVSHNSPKLASEATNPFYPIKVTGLSSQVLNWDNEAGMPHSYTEEFTLILDLASGDRMEFLGRSRGEVLESETLDRDKAAEEARDILDDAGFGDVKVEAVDEGIKIIIEDIHFEPNSASLEKNELYKLDKIGDILKKHSSRDIIVTGHTALAGTAEGQQQLSVARAKTVAEYLLSIDAKKEKQVRVAGKGATEPVADNSTEAGKRRNRRVEIIILEN